MIDSAIALLERLVAFDTTSRYTNLPLLDWVENYLTAHGFRIERIYDESGAKANLFATIGPEGVPGYVLSGHTDVVPVDGQDWSTPPFTLTRKDGLLYGRGAADMKGFLAVCLAKVPEIAAARLSRPIHLAFSYDEEVGCTGVRSLIADLRDRPVKPLACFVGEPTSMQVIVAHKAKYNFRATVKGKPCHSSLAPQGVNAIDYAARLIVFLRELGLKVAEGPRDPLYDVPFTTVHTGLISGGTALNIVPECCEVTFEFRSLPQADSEALVQEIRRFACEALEPEMKAIAPETGIDIDLYNFAPGLETPVDAEVTQLAMRFAGRNDHAKVAYATEACLFSEAEIPTVVVGPGSIEQAHKPDEFIAISELEKALVFVDRLIAHSSE